MIRNDEFLRIWKLAGVVYWKMKYRESSVMIGGGLVG